MVERWYQQKYSGFPTIMKEQNKAYCQSKTQSLQRKFDSNEEKKIKTEINQSPLQNLNGLGKLWQSLNQQT